MKTEATKPLGYTLEDCKDENHPCHEEVRKAYYQLKFEEDSSIPPPAYRVMDEEVRRKSLAILMQPKEGT